MEVNDEHQARVNQYCIIGSCQRLKRCSKLAPAPVDGVVAPVRGREPVDGAVAPVPERELAAADGDHAGNILTRLGFRVTVLLFSCYTRSFILRACRNHAGLETVALFIEKLIGSWAPF